MYLFRGSLDGSRGTLAYLLGALELYPVREGTLLAAFRHRPRSPPSNSDTIGYKAVQIQVVC